MTKPNFVGTNYLSMRHTRNDEMIYTKKKSVARANYLGIKGNGSSAEFHNLNYLSHDSSKSIESFKEL